MPFRGVGHLDHPLDGCLGGAWLGLSLCVGMPGWRLARLATMPFSQNSKYEFMRNSNKITQNLHFITSFNFLQIESFLDHN